MDDFQSSKLKLLVTFNTSKKIIVEFFGPTVLGGHRCIPHWTFALSILCISLFGLFWPSKLWHLACRSYYIIPVHEARGN